VAYEQHLRHAKSDLWHPDNALTLCRRCHSGHHVRSSTLSVQVLRPENLRFIKLLFGDFADDYVRRYYAP
jgi:hypothetical protein